MSTAVSPMDDEEIAAILTLSRSNNRVHQLTGALLYKAGRFIQVLEGPDDAVRARLDIIKADPRHQGVQTVSEKQIGARQFPDWTMGFRPLSDVSVRQLEGFDDFFRARTGASRLEHADNEAQQLLEWLSEYWFPSQPVR